MTARAIIEIREDKDLDNAGLPNDETGSSSDKLFDRAAQLIEGAVLEGVNPTTRIDGIRAELAECEPSLLDGLDFMVESIGRI